MSKPDRQYAFRALRDSRKRAATRPVRVASDDERAIHEALHEQLAEARADVEHDLDDVLSGLDTIWARTNFIPASGRGMDLAKPAFDRFVWVMLACGNGSAQKISHVERYRELCLEWLEFWEGESLARRRADDESIAAARIADAESLRRILSADTRMTWITQLILECTCAALQAQAGREVIPPGVGRELVRHLRRYAKCRALWRGHARPPALNKAALEVLVGASITAGQHGGRGFHQTLLSRFPETKPIILVGNEAFPAALRTALCGLEVGVFEWLADRGFDKGPLFEETLRRSLRQVAPPGVVVLPGDSRMRPPLARNELQTDLVIDVPANRTTVVGEAKCYLPSNSADRSALGKPLADAAAQAKLRADSFDGERVVTGVEGWTLDARDRDVAVPLVVPLQSSGQTVWSSAFLHEAEVSEGVVIMPVHQAVLAMSLMSDGADFCAYLATRQEALARQIMAFDEHELLLLHLAGRAHERMSSLTGHLARPAAAGQPDSLVFLVDHSIAFKKAFAKDRPPRRKRWRTWFFKSSKPINLAAYGSAEFLNV